MNLQLTSTLEIVQELKNRFDHFALVGMKDRGRGIEEIFKEYSGNSHTCMGLCDDIKDTILYNIQELEPEEENGQ